MMRHFGPLLFLGATAWGATSLTVQISTEIAPAGGFAQVKVTVPSPQLIARGELVVSFDPTVLETPSGVAVLSAAGDAWGSATVGSQSVDLQFASPSGGIGREPGMPILTLTFPIAPGAAVGTVSAVTATVGQTSWLDGSGNAYTVTVLPGQVTVGGSLSVQSFSPGGGLLPSGTVIHILGTGFTQATSVAIDGVSISATQYVGSQEIDVTLGGAAELTGKRAVLQNADGSQAQYYSAMPSVPDSPEGSATQYMLSLQTFTSAGQEFNLVGAGYLVLQNQNLTPATVYLQAEGLGLLTNLAPVTIPAGAMYVYSSVTLNAPAQLLATSSLPIRMLGPKFNDPLLGGSLTVSNWAVTPQQPITDRLSATPSAVSFSWQVGTAAPAVAQVQILQGETISLFTATTAAPFTVTASGTVPGTISIGVNTSGLTPGNYTGSVTVALATANPITLTIPLTLTVSNAPLLVATPTQLTESVSPSNTPAATIFVTSNGSSLAFTASSNVPWMTLAPVSNSTPASITASFNISGLAVGTYAGQIVLTGPSNSVTIPVSLTVGSGAYQISSVNLTFSAQPGGAAPAVQSFQAGAQPLTVSVSTSSGGNWLTATASGVNVLVSANQTGLPTGTYTGTITVSSPGAITAQSSATLVVYETVPPLTVTPQSLTFSGPADNLPAQTLTVQSGGVPVSLTSSVSTNSRAFSLGISPMPSQTPGTFQVTPLTGTGNLVPPGYYQANVTFSGAGETVNVPVTLDVTPASSLPPYIGSIVNAASQAQGAISPGELITIYGYSVGPSLATGFALNAAGQVATSLEGAEVLFDGKAAPLIYGSAGQLNVMAPYEIAGEAATVVSLNYGGSVSGAWAVPVAAAAPGVFTIAGDGVGPAAVLNEDGSVNSAANPAARGSVVQIYATGEGQTSPAGVTGSVTQSGTKTPVLPVTVTIGGVNAQVQYAGSAPASVAGLLQVNATVPQSVTPGGAVPVVVSVGGAASQAGATIAVK